MRGGGGATIGGKEGASQYITPKGAMMQGGAKESEEEEPKIEEGWEQTLMEEGGDRELTLSPSPNRELEGEGISPHRVGVVIKSKDLSQPKIALFLCEDNKEEPRRIAVGGILEHMNIQTDEPIMVENTICEDSHDRNIVFDVSKEDKSERTKEAARQDQDSDKDSLSTMITTPSVGTVAKQIVESQSLTGEGGYVLNDRVDMNLCHGMEVNGKATYAIYEHE